MILTVIQTTFPSFSIVFDSQLLFPAGQVFIQSTFSASTTILVTTLTIMISLKTTLFYTLMAAAQGVAGHSVITNAVGDSGGSGMALGVDTSTPRDGTRRRPFQQDATRFRGASKKTVGETVGAGDNDVESGTASILEETGDKLPQVTPGGELKMTLHQVNADGAGPYTCMINNDGAATQWTEIPVKQNVAGNALGLNRQGQAQDHPLTASIPDDQKCTGNVAGEDNVCLVRCQNGALAGPFGGVVPVQMVGGGNSTDDAIPKKSNRRRAL